MSVDLVSWLLVLSTQAAGRAEPDSLAGREGRFFSTPVDLWMSGVSYKPSYAAPVDPGAPDRVAVRENVWAQPIRTPDGNWLIYVPPKRVLDFLEDPSEASAKAYLAWKAEQSAKLRRAMVLLAEVQAPEQGAKPASPRDLKPTPLNVPFKLTYFKKPSCPHCVSQDVVLDAWLARRKSGLLETLLPGDRPELWRAYQVRGTPTLVLEAGGSGNKVILVGLRTEAALDTELAKLANSPAESQEPSQEAAR